jgi:hypothetical protein
VWVKLKKRIFEGESQKKRMFMEIKLEKRVTKVKTKKQELKMEVSQSGGS